MFGSGLFAIKPRTNGSNKENLVWFMAPQGDHRRSAPFRQLAAFAPIEPAVPKTFLPGVPWWAQSSEIKDMPESRYFSKIRRADGA
jgi:hypothetical protein